MLLSEEELCFAVTVHYSFLPKEYAGSDVEIAVTLLAKLNRETKQKEGVTARPKGQIGDDDCSLLPIDERDTHRLHV